MRRRHQPYRQAGKQHTPENQSLREVQNGPFSVQVKGNSSILAETATNVQKTADSIQ